MKFWIKRSLQEAGWAPVVVLLISFLLGNVFHAYSRFPGIDKTVHIGGGMAITHFFVVSIHYSQRMIGAVRRDRQLVLALILAFLVALAWEGIELFGDKTLHLKMNHGFTDTLLDILFGVLGGLIALFFHASKQPVGIPNDEKKSHLL
jgi:hypothetical protein